MCSGLAPCAGAELDGHSLAEKRPSYLPALRVSFLFVVVIKICSGKGERVNSTSQQGYSPL